MRPKPSLASFTGDRPVTSRPLRVTVPVSGLSWPRMQLKRVVFPQPFGPMTPNISPGAGSDDRHPKLLQRWGKAKAKKPCPMYYKSKGGSACLDHYKTPLGNYTQGRFYLGRMRTEPACSVRSVKCCSMLAKCRLKNRWRKSI